MWIFKKNFKIIFLTLGLLFASNATTYLIATPADDYCEQSIEHKRMLQEEEEFNRAFRSNKNLDDNRSGGLKITDKIR